MKTTRAIIDIPLTPDYVLNNAHARYWWHMDKDERAREDKGSRRMTLAKLKRGLTLLPTLKNDAMVGRIVTGEPDGEDLDVLLQLSMFGELLYG
jgi:hypothetical protein